MGILNAFCSIVWATSALLSGITCRLAAPHALRRAALLLQQACQQCLAALVWRRFWTISSRDLAALMHGDELLGACNGDQAAVWVLFGKPRQAPAVIRRDGRRGLRVGIICSVRLIDAVEPSRRSCARSNRCKCSDRPGRTRTKSK